MEFSWQCSCSPFTSFPVFHFFDISCVFFCSFSGCICQVHRAIPDVTIGDINTLRLHVKAHLFYWNATASNGPDCWIVNNVMFFFTNQINMDNHFKCIFLLLAAILYTYILFYGIYARGDVCVCLCVVLYLKGVFVIFFCVWKGIQNIKIEFSFILIQLCDYCDSNMDWSLVTFTWNIHLFKLAETLQLSVGIMLLVVIWLAWVMTP